MKKKSTGYNPINKRMKKQSTRLRSESLQGLNFGQLDIREKKGIARYDKKKGKVNFFEGRLIGLEQDQKSALA